MPPQTNAFICYSALSFDAATRIASSLTSSDHRLVFFCMFEVDHKRLPPRAELDVMSTAPHLLSEWSKPFAIARWFSRALKSLDLRRGGAQVVAYLPHPFEIPGNHFAYTRGAADRLELLPDGLINYSHRTLDPEDWQHQVRYEVRVKLRQLAALRYGLTYHKLGRGHLTQFRDLPYARTWYLSKQGLLTQKGELTSVPRSPKQISRNSSAPPSTLFLDQELTSIANTRLDDQVRTACTERLRQAAEGKKLLYKAHPRGKNRASELRMAGIEVEDLTGGETAEETILKRNVTHLLGFYSTPLVLLADDAALRRVAIFPSAHAEGLVRPALAEEIRNALSRSGVELLEIGQKEAHRHSSSSPLK